MGTQPFECFLMEMRDGDMIVEVTPSLDGRVLVYDTALDVGGDPLPEAYFTDVEWREIYDGVDDVQMNGESGRSYRLRRVVEKQQERRDAEVRDAAEKRRRAA